MGIHDLCGQSQPPVIVQDRKGKFDSKQFDLRFGLFTMSTTVVMALLDQFIWNDRDNQLSSTACLEDSWTDAAEFFWPTIFSAAQLW